LWQYRFFSRVKHFVIFQEILERPVGHGDWWLRVYIRDYSGKYDGKPISRFDAEAQPLGKTFAIKQLSEKRRDVANRILEKFGYDPQVEYLKAVAKGEA